MFIENLLRFVRPMVRCSQFNTRGLTTTFNTPKNSSNALQTAKVIRGTDREPAIIIHGVMPRSGTNYIAALLRLHPHLYAFPNEMYEVPLLKYSGDILDIQKRFIRSYNRNAERMGENDFLPLFGSSFIAYLHSFVPNGQRMLIKVPNVQYLSHFFSLFPHENNLMVMRDGRDLVSSTIKTWPQKKFSDVCEEWNRSARMILGFQDYYGDTTDAYLITKYEDAVRDPVGFVKNVCTRFGLDQDVYHYKEIEKIPVIGSSSLKQQGKVAWTPLAKPKSFNPIGRWHEWPDERKETFRKIAGRALINAGYCDNFNWCD